MLLKRIKLSSFLYCVRGRTEKIAHGPKLFVFGPARSIAQSVQRSPAWAGHGPIRADRSWPSDRIRWPSALLADQNRPTAVLPKP